MAAAIGLTTSNLNVAPGPARAGTTATDDGNVITAGSDSARARNAGDSKASDGDTAGRGALEITAIVVLLDQDTVPIDNC